MIAVNALLGKKLLFVALTLATLGCAAASAANAPADPPADDFCAMRPDAWCKSPQPNDPCNAHRDEASCKADTACVGMPYRGESMVACRYDARGFNGNCAIVGCRSREERR